VVWIGSVAGQSGLEDGAEEAALVRRAGDQLRRIAPVEREHLVGYNRIEAKQAVVAE
jgi:hypothetical protein